MLDLRRFLKEIQRTMMFASLMLTEQKPFWVKKLQQKSQKLLLKTTLLKAMTLLQWKNLLQ